MPCAPPASLAALALAFVTACGAAPAPLAANERAPDPAPTFVVHAPYGDARATMAVHDHAGAVPVAVLRTWVEATITAVVDYFGRFPVPALRLEVRPSRRGQGVVFGMAFGGRDPWMFVEVGAALTPADLTTDWVLCHELVHMAFPQLADRHRWAMEGMATWLEPFIRLRAGATDAASLWARFVERMPFGLPTPGDAGLDHTPTWGRTYWGGALFWLVAELDARRVTGGAHGLRTAFRGVLLAGGDKRRAMSLDDALALGDQALGHAVLAPLAATWREAPVAVDLDALWARLGVRREGGRVVFDDTAPDAALRRAIERQD